MKYRMDGDKVVGDGGRVVACWNPSTKRILDGGHMSKIDVIQQGSVWIFHGRNAAGQQVANELRDGKIKSTNGKELITLKDAKTEFAHPDDRAAAGFWLYLET